MTTDASPDVLLPSAHLRPVPDLRPIRTTPSAQGPFLSLSGPRLRTRPAAMSADCLQLRWSETEPRALQLVPPGPQQPLPGPGIWVLTVPLEPLLLQTSVLGGLQQLVIDHPEALPAGPAQQSLAQRAAALARCAEQGHTALWLQEEQTLIQQLAIHLQRPDLSGAQRRDRGWRHLNVSLAWMAEHLADDFNLPDVAAVAGVTPRALQMAYRRHLDKRPLQSLRLLRLAALRRLLLESPSPSRRLSDDLERCGLSRSGSTARHYQDRYGEKPSQTGRLATAMG